MVPSLIAIAFGSARRAGDALAALEELADEGCVRIVDAAVVARADDGSLENRQTRQLAVGEGIVGGGAVGLLLGVLAGGPIGGAAVGLAGGGLWTVRDTGLSDDELERLGKQLAAGRAALIALVRDVEWPRLAAALEAYGGELIAAEVSAAVAAALAEPYRRR